MKKTFAIVAAIGSLVLQQVQAAGQVGEPLGDFSGETDRFEKVSVEKLRAGKAAVVYFYSGCCGHCHQELAKWSPMARRLQAKGMPLIGIQYYGNSEYCKKKVDEHHLVGTVMADSDGSFCGRSGVGDFTVMVLDKSGVIRYRGLSDEKAILKIVEALK